LENSIYYLQEATNQNPLVKAIVPILAQIGFGGIVGFGLGFFFKKLGKFLCIVLALVFICLQVLIYFGDIPYVDWTRLSKDITGAVDTNFLNAVWNLIIHNLPFAGSFTVGFLWGLKKC